MPLFSQMSPSELEHEMAVLRQQGQAAYDKEDWSQYEVHMKKWYLAKSYLVRDAVTIEIGKTYNLIEEYDRITVTDVVGVMAWGTRESTLEEIALPIAMLTTEEPSQP